VVKNTQSDFFFQAAEKLNIPLMNEVALKFETYFQELIAWNKKVNLTRIIERKKVFIDHFLDSLIPARFIPPKSSLVDLGSGGGFPGIPLKILRPDLSVTLVDSSLKKCLFLRHLIRSLALREIFVLQERLENENALGNHYDVCISRAFAPLGNFLSVALPLRETKGMLVAMKGPNFLKELKIIEPRLSKWGISIKQLEKFSLPFTNKSRAIIVFG